jgi:mRNA interferase RelE/StbE
MMVILSDRAEKQLEKLPKLAQLAVSEKIRKISRGEEATNVEVLKGYKNVYRVRMGDYRMVYKKTESELHVVLIGHRREIYKLLERWWK